MQSTPCRSPVPLGASTSFQAEAPPVGLSEATIRPSLATATHREVPAQETPVNSGEPLTLAACQCADVGSVEVSTRPAEPPRPPETATQSEAEGQETAARCVAPGALPT